MASGKSLELAAIKPPLPKRVCTCGEDFDNHLRRDGRLLKKYSDGKHAPAGRSINRRFGISTISHARRK
jgi:hypothetical protein